MILFRDHNEMKILNGGSIHDKPQKKTVVDKKLLEYFLEGVGVVTEY